MAKTSNINLQDLFKTYVGNSADNNPHDEGQRNFEKKHITKKVVNFDPKLGAKNDQFQADNVKTIDREKVAHGPNSYRQTGDSLGYNRGDNEQKVYSEESEQLDEITLNDAADLIDTARKKFKDRGHPVHGDIQGLIDSINSGKVSANTYADNIKKHISGEPMNEAKEPSLTAGKRKVASFQGKDGHEARVYHDKEWEEYQVHHYNDGKHLGEGPVSYHDNKQDALDTAQHEVKNFVVNGSSLRAVKEEVELDETKMTSAQIEKRNEIADAIHKEHPEYSKEKKFKIATAAALKEDEQLDELKSSTVKSYLQKNWDQQDSVDDRLKAGERVSRKELSTSVRRNSGEATAVSKINGSAKVPATIGEATHADDCACGDCKSKKNITEKLVGDQKNIDANHNGKLDAQDFKLLRSKKKLTKEDVINAAVAKYAPAEVRTLEEQFTALIEGVNEAFALRLVALFESLNDINQQEMINLMATKEGMNQLIDFAINFKGE